MDESALRRALASLDDCSSSLHLWLGFWTFLVALGVALEIVFVIWEYIDDLRDCKRSLLYPPVKPNLPLFVLGFLGAALVAAGVAGELFVESKIATVETCIRKGNDQLSLLLSKEAGDARISAEGSARAAKVARDQSDEAVTSASHALALAQHATQEADSFEEDIKSAKKQADAAESHLNEALQRATDVTAELKRLTTPRRLPHIARVISPLKIFSGAEYRFIGTCGDTECFDLVGDIDDVLRLAGWKRAKSLPMRLGIPQYKIHGSDEFKVEGNTSAGITISVETPEGFDSIKNLTNNQWAEHIRAAIALNQVLISNVSPPDNGKWVGVDTGTSTVVRIDVGRKP